MNTPEQPSLYQTALECHGTGLCFDHDMFSGKALTPSLGECLLPHRFPSGRIMSEALAEQNLSLGMDGIMCRGLTCPSRSR